LLVVIGLARAGIRLFWRVQPPTDPGIAVAPARPLETAATALLLAYGIAMTLAAAPILRYTQATAAQLLSPADYVQQLRAMPSASRAP
jgi:multicomponent K+:H+ antiporter subunit D